MEQHSLLKRQLRRCFDDSDSLPDEWADFIDLVNEAYHQSDMDREMLERAKDLSSKEIKHANSNIRAVYERIITGSIDGIFAFDMDFNCTVWNPGMERITNVQKEEAVNQALFVIFPALMDTGDDKHLIDSLYGKTTVAKESSYVIEKTGEQEYFESHFSPLRSESKEIIGGLAIIRNITARKIAEQALTEMAVRDSLTNLYNRRYFNQQLEKEISRTDRLKKSFAILLCDLDDFKAVNDQRSHQFGDEVLKAVAKGIQKATRGIDLAFRWGGDEFVVLLSLSTREGIMKTANRIRKGIIAIGEQYQFSLDMSIGISLYPDHGQDVDQLIRLADRALYIAKKRADKINIGDDEYHLNENAVLAAFQPIVDIQTNEILGYEALGRDPQGKLSIYQLFKKYELIGKLSEFKEICFKKQVKIAHESGFDRTFINVDFKVLDRLDVFEKPPNIEVILEISEQEALEDVQHYLEITKKWREQGFKFAIDDFGAGFISLPFIARLVPDYIKLDRMTVLQAVSSEKFRKFLTFLILALLNYTKNGIIAEGIETDKELAIVKGMGIILVQGYLFGKPQIIPSPEANLDRDAIA